MPSALRAAAESAPLMLDLVEFATGIVESASPRTDHEHWRTAVLAGLIDPSPGTPRYGPTMLAWSPEDDLVTPQRVEPWIEVFHALLGDSPELVPILLVAFRDGQVAAASPQGFDSLERLGALVVDGMLVRLTPLGVRGLFACGRWADPSSWLLDPGEWWANLSTEDLVAFLQAAAQLRLVDQADTVERWFEQASPLQFAYQLVHAGPSLHGGALATAFGYLLRIGLDAAPAVEEWLANISLACWGLLWFDLIGAPRAGAPTEQEHACLIAESKRAVDDLRSLLDRSAVEPSRPPLPGATIDQLSLAIPYGLATPRVGELLQRLLNPDVPGRPGDRAELEQLLAETR
ncbi:hypothetical protein ACFPJ1_35960 [Kribbella qitaiheensis]|uniref:hypothetical protein n=1 Tax=Kribbella qitaiheensis TaxID=1544730 RepID=UPI00361423A0